MREYCKREECEHSYKYCQDEEVIPNGISLEPTISAYVQVDTCVEVPNYGEGYEIPEADKEHPCYRYYNTLSSLHITGLSSSTDDNGDRVKLEVHVPNLLRKFTPKYMELYTPGTVLFAQGEYMLPSQPGGILYVFNASVLAISPASIANLSELTGIAKCRRFKM